MEHENGNLHCTCSDCAEFRSEWIKAEYEVAGWLKEEPVRVPGSKQEMEEAGG